MKKVVIEEVKNGLMATVEDQSNNATYVYSSLNKLLQDLKFVYGKWFFRKKPTAKSSYKQVEKV